MFFIFRSLFSFSSIYIYFCYMFTSFFVTLLILLYFCNVGSVVTCSVSLLFLCHPFSLYFTGLLFLFVLRSHPYFYQEHCFFSLTFFFLRCRVCYFLKFFFLVICLNLLFSSHFSVHSAHQTGVDKKLGKKKR